MALGIVGFSTSGHALGLPDPFNYDMGPLGNWALSGGVSGIASIWNNDATNSNAAIPHTNSSTQADITADNAMVIINKTDGQLQFTTWLGLPPNTPVMGYTSTNVSPNLHGLCGKTGSDTCLNATGQASPLFKGYFTYQPIEWFSLQAGRLPSPDGTEVGVDWFNPTAFVSDLNNMQTTVGDGGQINLITPGAWDKIAWLPHYGSTLTIRLADGYKTGRPNELGFTGLWNLTSDGSDNIIGFGHTRLHTVGYVTGDSSTDVGPVAGFGTVNANLIGFGGAYVIGNFTISPEIEYQWLPKDSLSGPNAPLTTYSNTAMQVTVTYQINSRWSVGTQAQYITQHGDRADPNADAYGNFLGLNTSAAGGVPGTFGPGSDMFGIQVNPTWQFHNFFVRPAIAYTHLANFYSGDGYGNTGTQSDQWVGLVEVGFLIGQRAD
ncbi:MAG TPA: hypothetical protein VMF53_06855 [Alphaproteobacteria bacterium]|nr:hypothetical protein [Alphaproteobacteria bacterium]